VTGLVTGPWGLPTGAWTTWVTTNLAVNLNSNPANVIRFESIGQGLGNVDQIEIL
jgi:rhamnogalacturonan endolyase